MGVAHACEDLDEWIDVSLGKKPGHIYGRNTNPTVHVFEEKVRLLEGAEAATSAATGKGIISGVLCALLASGDRVVSAKDTYGGTSVMFNEFLPRQGVNSSLCDTTDHEAIEKEIEKGCKLLYLETPTNPTIKITDIARLAKAGHEAGAIVVVDNTFATPINQNPIALGADIVLHSARSSWGDTPMSSEAWPAARPTWSGKSTTTGRSTAPPCASVSPARTRTPWPSPGTWKHTPRSTGFSTLVLNHTPVTRSQKGKWTGLVAQGSQPGRSGNDSRSAGKHEPRGMHGGGKEGPWHPGKPCALFGGNRGYQRPDRRSRPGFVWAMTIRRGKNSNFSKIFG